ncbi:LiaI-LiaF-like domain-containing protein [Accumulibacter sp.]|uniref:LiaI-LiaF-like domain-containing protein n=1 Tax=Accumulibacter sp. TaxID=2053492 RepID=UPI0035B48048
MRGNLGAIALIVVGSLALASNLGLFDVDLGQLLRTWWPVLLILLGVGMFLAPATDEPRKRPEQR